MCNCIDVTDTYMSYKAMATIDHCGTRINCIRLCCNQLQETINFVNTITNFWITQILTIIPIENSILYT